MAESVERERRAPRAKAWRWIVVGLVLLAAGVLGALATSRGEVEERTAVTPEKPPALDETLPDDPHAADALRVDQPEVVPHYAPTWAPEGLGPAPKRQQWAFAPPFVKGFAVGAYMEIPGLPYDQLFSEIAELGATHVSLVVSWSQTNIRAVQVRPHPVETMEDAELVALIQSAKRQGLEVMLFPILHIDRRRSHEWRGRLAPNLPDLWWQSYTDFVLHYARIAASEGVAIYSVGSELLDLEGERERWLELIARTRGVYQGQLIYSANWDHFDGVTFWDALDLVGMTGYFELTDKPEPSLDELRAKWLEGASVIASYSKKVGKALILTEVGYPSQVGAAAHPWDYTRKKKPSGEAQYLAFRAMYEAWLRRAEEAGEGGDCGLGGAIVWNWYGYGGPEDGTYTLRGKPSTAIIKRWFQGQ